MFVYRKCFQGFCQAFLGETVLTVGGGVSRLAITTSSGLYEFKALYIVFPNPPLPWPLSRFLVL